MKHTTIKTSFLALTITVTAITGGMLIPRSTLASAQSAVNKANNQQEIAQNKQMCTKGHCMDGSMSMDLGPADANYDLRFIDGMTMHHQGAVDMAKEALEKSQRPEIKKLAQDIITAQNQEIAEMKEWRQQWYAQAGSTPMAWDNKMNHMMAMNPEMMQSMMMSMDLGAADADFDLRFLNAMIPHHEGALVMAKDALAKSQRTEIKELAENILTSQTAEIEQMQQWRKAWYNQ